MFSPYEVFVGLRYTRAKRRNHFISFISLTSMLGIALGVTALITVLSVMNGFEKELRERILGMASHATVSALDGRLEDWRGAMKIASGNDEVIGAAPFVRSEVMLSRAGRVSGALLRGVLPEHEPEVSEVAAKLVSGSLETLQSGEYGIVLGVELARYLGVWKGDRITVVTPEAGITPAGILPRLKRFTVIGLFEVGMYEYDRNLALIHLDDASRLLRLDGAVSGVRLKLRDLFLAPRVVREVASTLGGAFTVSDWTREHANFFRAIQTEKRVMFIILLLIVAVAAFNIVSTLVMTVNYCRHAAGPGRGHRPGAQCRDAGAGDRAPVRDTFPLSRRLLHQRPAIRPALVGRRPYRRDVTGVVVAGHALPGVARITHAAGRGAAL